MTLQPPPQATRNRFRTWLLAGIGVFAIAALVIGVILVNGSSSSPSPSTSRSSTQSGREVFLALATETMAVSGGNWTFDDKKTPFSLREARKDKPEECLSDSSTEQYSITLYGPAADRPSEAIEKMTRHWESLHYSVRTVADTGEAMQIAAVVPDGSEIGYFASTGITSISVQGPCVKTAS